MNAPPPPERGEREERGRGERRGPLREGNLTFVTFIKFTLYITLIIIKVVTNVIHVTRKIEGVTYIVIYIILSIIYRYIYYENHEGK